MRTILKLPPSSFETVVNRCNRQEAVVNEGSYSLGGPCDVSTGFTQFRCILCDFHYRFERANSLANFSKWIGTSRAFLIAHPQTSTNSRHSPLLIPEASCVTVSPASRRFRTAMAFADSVTPPIR